MVIPTFNRAQFVPDAVASAIHQDHEPLEVLVVDDGSTDETENVLRRRFGSAITYVRQENRERGAARNAGLRKATGSYVAFLDSDDRWLPYHLTKLAEFAARSGATVVFSQPEFLDLSMEHLVWQPPLLNSPLTTTRLIRGASVSPSCVLADRKSLTAMGGFHEDRLMSGSEDWHLWLRASLIEPLLGIPERTVQMRSHPGRSMQQRGLFLESYSRAVELLLEGDDLVDAGLRSKLRFYSELALANACSSLAKHREARRHLVRALHGHPLGVCQPGYLAAVVKWALRRQSPWHRQMKNQTAL